jgi:hypothetical protein
MRFQKAIKRIVALGTGALMLSSFAAAAPDLGKYPEPFVKDGKFSGVLVVGDKAAAEDVIGISDIIASLQFAATTKAPAAGSGSKTVVSDGDAWKVGRSTKILEISEDLTTGTNREAIANITSLSFIDDEEMPGLLSSQSLSNPKGQASYDQRLYFEDPNAGYVLYTENDDDVTADFLYFPNGRQIARYEMEFTEALESDVDDSAGSASTTGTFLTDLEDMSIKMLGKPFEIVTAKRGAAAGNGVILTLMGGAVRDTLLEGDTKTYTIDGKDYEVTLNFVDSDEAQFTINGETTRKLLDGETDKLVDGTTVGVSDILYQDYAGGIHSSTFFIGAQKVELRDTDIETSGSSHELKVDDETIDEADVSIEGSDDNTTLKIDRITINITADDDFWVPAGGKLSEAIAAEGSEPDALFTRNWDIEYLGLSEETLDTIKIVGQGSDDYNLVFSDGRGNAAKVPLANSPGSSVMRFGDNDDDLIVAENKTITKDDYFFVVDTSDEAGERTSFALRYRGADKPADDNPVLKFDELGSGERIERPVSVTTTQGTVIGPHGGFLTQLATIKLGGASFKVYNTSTSTVDDYSITVDLDASGTVESGVVTLNTKGGAAIAVTNDTNLGIGVSITTPNSDDYDDLAPTALLFNLTADSNGEVRMTKQGGQIHNFISPEDDNDNEFVYTSMGAFVKYYSPSSSPQELTVWYPQEQRVPEVFITSGASFGKEATGSASSGVVLQRIQVGAAKLASEVSDVKGQNSILVGGPCANAASSTVMGNPTDCAKGFEPGAGMLQMFEHANGNVAMLVAGYSAVDTRNAAQVVANYQDYAGQLKGAKVEVKKVNNQLTVATPSEKAKAPSVDEGDAMMEGGDEGTA